MVATKSGAQQDPAFWLLQPRPIQCETVVTALGCAFQENKYKETSVDNKTTTLFASSIRTKQKETICNSAIVSSQNWDYLLETVVATKSGAQQDPAFWLLQPRPIQCETVVTALGCAFQENKYKETSVDNKTTTLFASSIRTKQKETICNSAIVSSQNWDYLLETVVATKSGAQQDPAFWLLQPRPIQCETVVTALGCAFQENKYKETSVDNKTTTLFFYKKLVWAHLCKHFNKKCLQKFHLLVVACKIGHHAFLVIPVMGLLSNHRQMILHV